MSPPIPARATTRAARSAGRSSDQRLNTRVALPDRNAARVVSSSPSASSPSSAFCGAIIGQFEPNMHLVAAVRLQVRDEVRG